MGNEGRRSYYDWLSGQPSSRTLENQALGIRIKEIHMASHGTYGTRRIRQALLRQGLHVSRRRIGKLMKQHQLICKSKRRFKVTTNSNHALPISPNRLRRNFFAGQANQKYVGDITYICTQEGWLYLAVVIDLFSRRVVGWSMQPDMKATLVNKALLMAIGNRKPSRGLLWHTDRGSQYAAQSHQKILKAYGIIQSMSGKGDCWDNAVAESFFHTLKTECTHHFRFKTRQEAKQTIFQYIEVFYNQNRMHSANQYLSPSEFENCRKNN
jgi:putative transposase